MACSSTPSLTRISRGLYESRCCRRVGGHRHLFVSEDADQLGATGLCPGQRGGLCLSRGPGVLWRAQRARTFPLRGPALSGHGRLAQRCREHPDVLDGGRLRIARGGAARGLPIALDRLLRVSQSAHGFFGQKRAALAFSAVCHRQHHHRGGQHGHRRPGGARRVPRAGLGGALLGRRRRALAWR